MRLRSTKDMKKETPPSLCTWEDVPLTGTPINNPPVARRWYAPGDAARYTRTRRLLKAGSGLRLDLRQRGAGPSNSVTVSSTALSTSTRTESRSSVGTLKT